MRLKRIDMKESPIPQLDETEAPRGYRAVLKSEAKPKDGSNICRSCDWRPACQKPDTNFRNHNHRCMSYTVVTQDGTRVRRYDGCSVVFKKYYI